jgi:hypothetical protein
LPSSVSISYAPRIRHTTPLQPPDSCRPLSPASSFFNYENATFIDAVRSAPFVPSSTTLGYSEASGPLYAPYIDPPIAFADSPLSPMNDLRLYSFSTSSSSDGDRPSTGAALDLSLPTRDKGKRPYRRATFSRKVSKKDSLASTVEMLPPPNSPQPSTSQPPQPYLSSDSD